MEISDYDYEPQSSSPLIDEGKGEGAKIKVKVRRKGDGKLKWQK